MVFVDFYHTRMSGLLYQTIDENFLLNAVKVVEHLIENEVLRFVVKHVIQTFVSVAKD